MHKKTFLGRKGMTSSRALDIRGIYPTANINITLWAEEGPEMKRGITGRVERAEETKWEERAKSQQDWKEVVHPRKKKLFDTKMTINLQVHRKTALEDSQRLKRCQVKPRCNRFSRTLRTGWSDSRRENDIKKSDIRFLALLGKCWSVIFVTGYPLSEKKLLGHEKNYSNKPTSKNIRYMCIFLNFTF